jgi:hypothetical protein
MGRLGLLKQKGNTEMFHKEWRMNLTTGIKLFAVCLSVFGNEELAVDCLTALHTRLQHSS